MNNYLIIGGILIILILIFLIFRPKKGWFWQWKYKNTDYKVLTEDILKETFKTQSESLAAEIDIIRERLNISESVMSKVLQKMQEKQLIQLENEIIHLTPEGEQYALQIIRLHRLYERYLAEKTGYCPSEWHLKAEQMEHQLSGEKLQKLIDEVGDPRYDPHGDPIPTSEGELQRLKGITLDQAKQGIYAKIIHIEDEPKIIYKQILAENIQIGATIYINDISDDKISFYSEGEDFILISDIAKNITITELPKPSIPDDIIRLSSLKKGETAEIVGLSQSCRGANRWRLLDLGFVKGSTVSIDLVSPAGNPRAYLIRNTSIALREDQAQHIKIRKLEL